MLERAVAGLSGSLRRLAPSRQAAMRRVLAWAYSAFFLCMTVTGHGFLVVAPMWYGVPRWRQLNAADNINDLRIPPGNRLEKLAGNRAGQHSIRINDFEFLGQRSLPGQRQGGTRSFSRRSLSSGRQNRYWTTLSIMRLTSKPAR